jgi:hypothetical protein
MNMGTIYALKAVCCLICHYLYVFMMLLISLAEASAGLKSTAYVIVKPLRASVTYNVSDVNLTYI